MGQVPKVCTEKLAGHFVLVPPPISVSPPSEWKSIEPVHMNYDLNQRLTAFDELGIATSLLLQMILN